MAETKPAGPSTLQRIADYFFGRNALIGLASLMLLVISGYATWSGMHDFIVGVSQTASQGRELVGGLSVTNDMLVIAIVVALTFLMWLALRETFGAKRTFRERMIMFPLYAFLFLWSVGFGYGFWWSLIAGEEATRTGLSSLQEDARDAGGAIAARLDAVKIQLDSVVTWSDGQMAREEASGGSCGVPSGAGRGPLYNARRSVRDSIASLRDNVANAWIAPVQADLEKLRQTAAGLAGTTTAERQQEFEQMAARIRGTARSIAARSNELGRSTAAEMRAVANAVSTEPGKPGFSCYDPTLAQRLRQAADQAAQPASLALREAEFSEGPAGVANAVKNLWSNIGGAIVSGPRALIGWATGRPVDSAPSEPLTGRDLIALLATLGIDLGLFALTVLNPPATPPVRHQPSPAVIRQIRAAMMTAISRAKGADIEWVRRHFIHHNKASYFVIPNLYSCDASNADESSKALAMNQLAGVLDDLDLVRWPTKKELEALRKEEGAPSLTDLTEVRRNRLSELEKDAKTKGIHLDPEKAKAIRAAEPLRNHGLLSKAEHALQIAGWSDPARRDIEIFVIEDVEGLTPLLIVLNEWETLPEADKGAPGQARSEPVRSPPAA